MAKISVIIPAYNAETTLRTAVESILSQQVPELEIIIVSGIRIRIHPCKRRLDGRHGPALSRAGERVPLHPRHHPEECRYLRGPQPRHGGRERGVHHLL